jgi:hypothetical protein
MSETSITTEIHQPLDVHAHFATKITLDLSLTNCGAKLV